MPDGFGSGSTRFGGLAVVGVGASVAPTLQHGSGSSVTGRFVAGAVGQRTSDNGNGGDGGHPIPPDDGDGTILFTPPQRHMVTMIEGALRYSYQVSQTVWKDADGVWHSEETPAGDLLLTAQRILAYGGRPQLVDQETADELTAAGIGTVESQ